MKNNAAENYVSRSNRCSVLSETNGDSRLVIGSEEGRCIDGNTVGYRFAAPVFLRPTGIERGERKRESRRRRVSNLFPWGPNPSAERRKQTDGGRETAQEGKRRIYVFGEGQGNEGSDKCSGVVQLDATGDPNELLRTMLGFSRDY
ncbi:PREDICTED: uncharacterized protein LOC108554515 [Eufriesea mexicana]|uniref:uncharacterized protein LOC108554515 n=1 Tax=Eufriesea mexicana TaxID=516756 RepID=UPI00083BAA28|nr:PREDICTED: uncharacterized protein LOC108554515 [Eufriesea mexicana]